MVEPEVTSPHGLGGKARKIAFIAVILAFIFGVLFSGWIFIYAKKKGPGEGSETAVIKIPYGTSFDGIVEILADKGVIHSDIRFKMLAHIYDLSSKLRAGEFELKLGELPLDVLRTLERAKSLQHKVTIAEGLNAKEIASLLSEQNWCDEQRFLHLINNPEFIHKFNIDTVSSLEGYLFPDTYYFTRIPELSTDDIVEILVRRFLQVWKHFDVDSSERHTTVILASIVEKETADPAERPIIASVFLNRLGKGMRLQSDPTVIYGIRSFSGNLTKKDLQTPTPYNTYTLGGLPAGPICNPGREALRAVLHPAEEKYLYFVSKNDGTHYFSKNLREHNRAVNKYQRKKRKK